MNAGESSPWLTLKEAAAYERDQSIEQLIGDVRALNGCDVALASLQDQIRTLVQTWRAEADEVQRCVNEEAPANREMLLADVDSNRLHANELEDLLGASSPAPEDRP